MSSYSRPILAALFVLALGAASLPAQAQRAPGAAGLGIQAGEPSGITLKIYNPDRPSYDFLAAWSFDNFFFLNAHVLFEQPLSPEDVEQPVQWFIGPGAYIGIDEDGDSEAGLGVSGTIGLDILLADHFELYIQATPRFELIRETEPDIGGGLGLRYYF
jgi:hypothetical protein